MKDYPPKLPDILRKELITGNKEQIAALKQYEYDLQQYNTTNLYEVTGKFDNSYTIRVRAKTDDEALENCIKLMEEFFINSLNDILYTTMVLPK